MGLGCKFSQYQLHTGPLKHIQNVQHGITTNTQIINMTNDTEIIIIKYHDNKKRVPCSIPLAKVGTHVHQLYQRLHLPQRSG